ncbi:MAG: response regulator [Deltaproteobacteria bacterium]|nr:response regulator [Deltaproteobacteria bacterium]
MSYAVDLPVINILIVDDDPAIGELIANFMRREGHNPVICMHPDEAIDLIKKNSFHLAFIDINLPVMDGIELAANLKNINPDLEAVFITGFGTFDNAIQAIKVGAYDYLRKPFGISELNLCVKRFQERMLLKEQVKIAEQRYFNLVQNIPCIVFIVNRDYNLEFINRAGEPLLGFTAERALACPGWLMERIHQDDRQRIKETFSRAFQSQNFRFSEECRMIHRGGHIIHAMMGSITGGKPAGAPANTIKGMIVDITDRVFLEKEVIQKEKLKLLGSISAEVAHGIRNPLVSIGGFARRLRKRFPDLPEGDIILNESKRLEGILKRIAEYLKPVEVNYEECLLNSLVSFCVEKYLSETAPRKVNIRLNLDNALAPIKTDRDIVIGAFSELIRISEKENDNGRELTIKTYESDNKCHVEFKNRISGTKAENPDMFFLPFNTSEKDFSLPLSYRLLKDIGGLLSYAQEEKEVVFTVSLPKKPLISILPGITLRA